MGELCAGRGTVGTFCCSPAVVLLVVEPLGWGSELLPNKIIVVS